LILIVINDIATNVAYIAFIQKTLPWFIQIGPTCFVHMHSVLTQDFSRLHNWSSVRNVILNPQKTAVMTI